jgi:hypothetical protein
MSPISFDITMELRLLTHTKAELVNRNHHKLRRYHLSHHQKLASMMRMVQSFGPMKDRHGSISSPMRKGILSRTVLM